MSTSATLAHLRNRLSHAQYDLRVANHLAYVGTLPPWDPYAQSLRTKISRLEVAIAYLESRRDR